MDLMREPSILMASSWQKPTPHTVTTSKAGQTAGWTSASVTVFPPDVFRFSVTEDKSSNTGLTRASSLDVLRHSAVVLVYLICTIIAVTKTWICWKQK
ncbi:hypothetical protein GN956_G25679 [Arapaima gigas]